MAKPLDPIVSARVPDELKEEIEEAARAAGLTRSDFIKSALITTVRQPTHEMTTIFTPRKRDQVA